MDKQKLIAIAKDQLKGGIGEEQVRELLTYRGVEPGDVDAIMHDATHVDDQTSPAEHEDVVQKTDAVIAELLPDVPVQPEYIKKERRMIVLSIVIFILVVIAGSVVYYVYF